MGKPKITIDGVLATSGREGQFWQFRAGAFPAEVPLIVHSDLDDRLQSLPNPVSLTISGTHFENQTKKQTEVRIENLFLTRRQSVERGHRIRWFLTDIRSFLQKLWVFSDFSVRRPLNEFLGFGVGGQEEFHRTPKFAYIPHTNRDTIAPASDPAFASGDTDPEVHRPWTAKQACLWMLQGFFRTEPGRVEPTGLPQGWSPTVVDNSGDNGRLLVDFRTNKPWPIVMTKLLAFAHIGLYVDARGQFVLYDIDPVELPAGVGGYSGGGVPVTQDASRSRPSKVRVYFRTERELRFDFLEATSEASVGASKQRGRRDIALQLENVIILPQEVKEVTTGRTFQRGSIVSIPKALELWNQDPDNPPPETLTGGSKGNRSRINFNLDFIRKNIMSPALATKLTLIPRFVLAKDNVFAARASALYSSYRQVFRVPPVWLDMTERLRLERTAIMDQVSGKRAPSPVFMDYFLEYSARYFHYKGSPKDLKAGLNVRAWNGALATETNFDNLPLDQAQASPAKLSWVNRRQGVFRVNFLPDLYGNTVRFIPSVFADDRVPVTLLGGVGNTWHLHQMAYEKFFRLSTIISATLRTPNDHRKLFFIDYDKNTAAATEADASGPPVESLFSTTHAGIAWVDRDQVDPQGKLLKRKSTALVRKVNGLQQVIVEGGALTNESVIKDAAEAVLEDVKFRTADATLGAFAAPGIDLSRDFPQGQVRSVTLRHQNGHIEALYNAEQPPVPPPIWERLPQATQNFLFRIEGDPNP